jgi:Protein of unknown function (DUF3485)
MEPRPMKTSATLYWWIGAGVLMLAALVWRFAPLPDAAGRLAGVVARPGQRLQEMSFASWEKEYFGAARAKRWQAMDSVSRVVATVVDGSGNRRAVHDPGFCFRGAGWTVAAEAILALPHGEARRVTLRRDSEELEAVYWFSDGRRAHASPVRYWMDTTARRLTLGHSGPEPVLVLLVPAQGRASDWAGWLRRWPVFTEL